MSATIWRVTVKTMDGAPGETMATAENGTEIRTQRRMSGRHAPGMREIGWGWVDGAPVSTVEEAQAEAEKMASKARP